MVVCSFDVPYLVMATRTAQSASAAIGMSRIDCERDLAMTFAAGALGDVVIAGCDPQWVRVPPCGEVKRVPESVLRFCQIFRNQTGRRMTVVADRDGSMARARPRVEMILHDVAIRTRPGIVGEIGIPFCVDEGVGPEADNQSNERRRQ